MASTPGAGRSPRSRLAARLAALLAGITRIEDLTAARVGDALGIAVRADPDGRFSHTGPLTPTWRFVVKLVPVPVGRWSFIFQVVDPQGGTSADMDDVADLDLGRLADHLAEAGYHTERRWGEHGQLLGHTFTKGPIRISVRTRGESDSRIEHACFVDLRVR